MTEFEQTLVEALPEFNRIRVPEVEATVKEVSKDSFTVFFSGSFCHTCGYYDYFEDLLYLLLDDYSLETEIVEIKQEIEGDYVKFRVTSSPDQASS
jgi:superoxide reductase